MEAKCLIIPPSGSKLPWLNEFIGLTSTKFSSLSVHELDIASRSWTAVLELHKRVSKTRAKIEGSSIKKNSYLRDNVFVATATQ